MTSPLRRCALMAGLLLGAEAALAAPICTPRGDEETHLSAEILREALMARSPSSAEAVLALLRLGTLRCSDHVGVVQALAQDAGSLRSESGRQLGLAAWQHLQELRPDSHLNPTYQARVVHLAARTSPLDLDALAEQVRRFEAAYGPGSGWVEALAADEGLQVTHRATRREVLQTAASAAHNRARTTGLAEDWDRALTWTLWLGGDGTDPEATRAWALAAWESGDPARAEAVLRTQAGDHPDQAVAALGTLATLHWNERVVTRGKLAAPPEAREPESWLVLEGGHTRARYPLADADHALLRVTDDFLALSPPEDADPSPPGLALAAAVVTLTHGQLPETRARLVAVLRAWPASPEAVQAAGTLAAIGETYRRAPRAERPADLCVDHAAAVAWADQAGADADPDTLGALAGWRAPRCRGGAAD